MCAGRCLLPGNPKPRHAPCPRQNKQHQEAVFTASARSHALSNMGRLLEDRGHPDEALLCFQEASTADSGSAEALCCRAGNIHRRGDLDGAAFYFQAVRGHWRLYDVGGCSHAICMWTPSTRDKYNCGTQSVRCAARPHDALATPPPNCRRWRGTNLIGRRGMGSGR